MAEIQPVCGWRYNAELSADIDAYVSPLFDVVSTKQREALYRNPFNSIHLSVPRGPDPAAEALRRLKEWKQQGVLKQDDLPGIYAYYQYFRLPGTPHREYCRKGFMCHIRAYDWAENVVLRHENTLPTSVNDRAELLACTEFQTSATHGLYRDDTFELERYLDEAMQDPLYQTEEDYQGARDVLAVIQDARVIRRFQEVLASRQVILADGHHRYEGSLVYRQARMLADPENTGNEPWHFHLMYLTNSAADDLRILPTHRLLLELPGQTSDEEFLKQLARYFTVLPKDDAYDLPELIAGKTWAFGLYLDGKAYKLRLKPEVHSQLTWDTTPEVKALDLTVLHYFVLERVLGIAGPDAQRQWTGIAYVRNFSECLTRVDRGEARAAFITNEVTMDEVERVCHSGAVMPPKSTFFYPKTIGGFLFTSIRDDENQNAFQTTLTPGL
ncbi:DUF1015 domain-containing protein [Hymenobacter jejuensis]|uniref:DUF1015 domain-containing protein n=1 Tax=Hymenobacter jejuensis TaxID=2502781 RepID=A0A5B8A3P0_9BACT|nr:DUF1015 domain-containing protein [Hymenobacter jejuensis]QDA61950.1 DUF1015 domain-containing protein [Hymenobacter jejuensis]